MRFPKLTRSQFELARFTFYLMTPISIMYYVGIDTDKKFNVPGFWPDPDTLNKIPKEPYEIQAELARIRAAKAEKRKRLEEKARQMGITPESVRAEEEAKKAAEQAAKAADEPVGSNAVSDTVADTVADTAGAQHA